MGSCGFIYVRFIGREICKTFTRQELSCHSQRSQPRSPQRSGASAMFELGECQSGVPASSNQFSKFSRGLKCFLQDCKAEKDKSDKRWKKGLNMS